MSQAVEGSSTLPAVLALSLKARHRASAVVELAVAAVGKGEVDGLCAVRELDLLARQVLHAGGRTILRDALGHKLKLVTLKVDERAQGVDVLGVGRIDIDGDLIAGIDLGLAPESPRACRRPCPLLGAAVERRHGEGSSRTRRRRRCR